MIYKVCFVLVLLASLSASCGLDNEPQAGPYAVQSDCPGASSLSGTLTIAEDQAGGEGTSIAAIMEIEGADAYGFPTNSFAYSIGGIFSSENGPRACTAQLFERKSTAFLFACKENGRIICTIFFKHQ